jgi:thiosulfate dehydrogenase [quinone] large subunit
LVKTLFRNVALTSLIWVIARILLAYIWLPSGLSKVVGPESADWVGPDAGTAVAGYLRAALAGTEGQHPDVYRWYAWLIQNVLLPNAVIFSYAVAVGQVLIGLAILLGFFTRLSTAVALLMNLAAFYAGTVSRLPYVLPLELGIVFLGYYAGNYGLDGQLLAKASRWFRPPREGEPSHGAALVWEWANSSLIVILVCLLAVAILNAFFPAPTLP